LRADIAGAEAAGIDSGWVLGGLHGEHLGSREETEAEAARAGLAPIAAIQHLVW
ncbi:MAG: TIGR01459 family HAD-type hydrolase, partial [Acetobacteraceae bacterium]|nr:TIGR01459 family HAD-type hydrolase [Acetobacteraceae bacterium]